MSTRQPRQLTCSYWGRGGGGGGGGVCGGAGLSGVAGWVGGGGKYHTSLNRLHHDNPPAVS